MIDGSVNTRDLSKLIIQDDFVCQWKKMDRCASVLTGRMGMFNITAHTQKSPLFFASVKAYSLINA